MIDLIPPGMGHHGPHGAEGDRDSMRDRAARMLRSPAPATAGAAFAQARSMAPEPVVTASDRPIFCLVPGVELRTGAWGRGLSRSAGPLR